MVVLLRVPLLNLSFAPSFEPFLKTIMVLLWVPLLNLSFELSFEPFLKTNGGFA